MRAGSRGSRSKYPLPGGQTKIKIPTKPFMAHKIASTISNSNNISKQSDAVERVEYQINRVPSMKIRYLMFMLRIRKDIQDSYKVALTENKFDERNVNRFIDVAQHPTFVNIKETLTSTRKRLTDDQRESVIILLEDLLLLIEQHLTDIVTNIQLTYMPEYKDFVDKLVKE